MPIIEISSLHYPLSRQVIQEADNVVRIPMHHEADSLNVASASAVAFWELRAK